MREESKQSGDTSDEPLQSTNGLGTQIGALFRGLGIDQDIPEVRGFPVKAHEFGSSIPGSRDFQQAPCALIKQPRRKPPPQS